MVLCALMNMLLEMRASAAFAGDKHQDRQASMLMLYICWGHMNSKHRRMSGWFCSDMCK